jgi:hypothetical protein
MAAKVVPPLEVKLHENSKMHQPGGGANRRRSLKQACCAWISHQEISHQGIDMKEFCSYI